MPGRVGRLCECDLENVVESDSEVFRPVKKDDIEGLPISKDRSEQRDDIGRGQGQKRKVG